MTKVFIDPGVCGFQAKVTAASEDQQEVKLAPQAYCFDSPQLMLRSIFPPTRAAR